MKIENLNEYSYDETLLKDNKINLIIKGFAQDKIVKKIIERNGNRSYGLTYLENSEKRNYSKGIIAVLRINKDAFNLQDLKNAEFKIECLEPFSISVHDKKFAYNSGSEIIIQDVMNENFITIRHKWLSFIHTLEFSENGNFLLASSAGFDTILEFEVGSQKLNWEWNLWDYGLNYSSLTNTFISRKKDDLNYLTLNEDKHLHIKREDFPEEGIPTYKSPNRLNGASYWNNMILVTGFHRPDLIFVTRGGYFKVINLNLKHPHSFKALRFKDLTFFGVTDSGRGKFLLLDQNFIVDTVFDFSKLSCDNEKKIGFGEWIQSVSIRHEPNPVIIAIDSLRNGIHLIKPDEKIRRFISTPSDWTIQSAFLT